LNSVNNNLWISAKQWKKIERIIIIKNEMIRIKRSKKGRGQEK